MQKPKFITDIILTYQVFKLLLKGFIKLSEYLQDFFNIFNLNKANKFPKQKGFKYFINIINLLLYKPLYNLFKA